MCALGPPWPAILLRHDSYVLVAFAQNVCFSHCAVRVEVQGLKEQTLTYL